MTKANELILIKFGGEVADSPTDLEHLSHSLKALIDKGNQVVLVHGGGPQATELSKRLGLEPKMVGGRRVTCRETLEVMKMVLPGVIHCNVLSMLQKFQLPVASVNGITMIEAHRRPPKAVSGSNGEKIDFGFVGDIDEVKTSLIQQLLNLSYLPVVSPIAADKEGQALNINADTVASAIARQLKVTRLVMLTKVGGVFADINDPKSRFKKLSMVEAQQKIKSGVIQGGMIPKLEEGFELLKEQLQGFHIVGANTPTSILEEIEHPGSIGTAIFS